MAIGPPGAPPPPDPWHRRYWTYYNRPYPGCGCLWTILVIIIIWWIIAALAYPPARFGWW
jgi:hypothetical protein